MAIYSDRDVFGSNPTKKLMTDEEVFGQPSRTISTTAQDVAATAAKGITGLSDAVTGLADIPTLGQAGRARDLVGLNEVYDDPMQAEQALNEHQQNIAAGKRNQFIDASPYSKPQQYAQQQVSDADGVLGKLSAAVRNPSTIATAVGESIPTMVAGGAVGRAITAASPLISGVVGGALGEGLMGAGSAAEQTRQQTADGTLSPAQTAMAIGSGIGTAAFGYAGGKLANKLGLEDIDTMFANGFSRTAKQAGLEAGEQGFAKTAAQVAGRIAGGGISEGLFEELPQSIQEQMWQNAAVGKPLTEGVDEAAVMGFLSGAAMGGPVNALPRPEAKATIDTPPLHIEQSAPKGPLSKAASMLIGNGGLYGTAPAIAPAPTEDPRMVEAWANQTEQAAAYNQQRNQLGATPSARAALMGVDQSPVTAGGGQGPLQRIVNEASLDRNSGTGLPVTPDESVLTTGATTPAMQQAEKAADYQDVFSGPSVLSDAAEQRLSILERKLSEGQTGERFQKDDGSWDGVKSTNPEWLKSGPLKEVGKAGIATVIAKARNGEAMTDRQRNIWAEVKKAADWEWENDHDTVVAREAEKIQKQTGIELDAPKPMPAGNLQEGDKAVVLDKNGIPDVVTHKGWTEDGQVRLKDGVEIVVDPWDPIQTMGVQINEDKWVNPNAEQNGNSQRTGSVQRAQGDLQADDIGAGVARIAQAQGATEQAPAEVLPRDIGATLPASVAGDAAGFIRDQQIRKEATANAPIVRQPGEKLSAFLKRRKDEQAIRSEAMAAGGEMVTPGADAQGFIRDQQLRGEAQGTVKDSLTVQPRQTILQLQEEQKAERAAFDAQAHEAATSPLNDKPEPTQAQKEAGNYSVGHVNLHGMDISIENPQGSERKGVDQSGNPWSVKMKHHYGYFKWTIGPDKDHVDVFVGPKHESEKVFVVDQVDPKTGKFDEPKVVLGAVNKLGAKRIYLSNYEKGWKGAGAITEMNLDQFKEWAYNPKTSKKPAAEFVSQNAQNDPQGGLSLTGETQKKSTKTSIGKTSRFDYGDGTGVSEAARELRDLAYQKKKQDDDVFMGSHDNYVPFKEAVSRAREAIAAGVRPVPLQIAYSLDIAPGEGPRVLAAAQTTSNTTAKADRPGGETVAAPSKEEASNSTVAKNATVAPSTSTQGESNGEERQGRRETLLNDTTPSESSVGAGAETPPASDKFAGNKVFTSDKVAAARERLKAKRGTLSSGFDPELMQDLLVIGGAHFEAGVRKFSDWAKAVMNDIGAEFKPFLRGTYENLRHYPGIEKDGMSTAADIDAINLDEITVDPDNTGKEQQTKDGVTNDNISGRSQKGDGQPLRKDDQGAEESGNQPLAPVAAEAGQAVDQTEPASDRGPGRSGKGKRGNQGTDGLRVSAPRGRRGRAAEVHTEGAGTGSDSGNGRPESLTEAPATIPDKNFTITAEVNLGQGGQAQKYKDNVAAIRILKQLTAEQRRATADEQKALARYVGWGGIPNAFRNSMTGEVKDDWQDRVAELEGLLTKEELETARNSTQNAHYTASGVVTAMWDALRHLGFNGGLALEPSVGTGNFIGLVPQDISGNTKFIAAEFDGVTAGIAQALYPQEAIFHTPFEKLPLPSEEFDLVIGNPPFGQTSLSFAHLPGLNRHTIHNQFFLAGLEALKPGGVQAFVVSRYLMDAKDTTVREEIAKQARLLAAVRLPQTAFKDNALTDVVTDIIFLQKPGFTVDDEGNTVREPLPIKPNWVETVEVMDQATGEPMTINTHFAQRPDMVMGKIDRSGPMRYKGDVTVRYDGKDLHADIAIALRKALVKGSLAKENGSTVSQQRFKTMADSLAIALSGAEDGSIAIDQQSGKLMQVREMKMAGSGSYMLTRIELTPETPWSNKLTMEDDGTWIEEVDKVDDRGEKVKDGKRNVKEIKRYSDKGVPEKYRLGTTDYNRLVDAVGVMASIKRQISLEMDIEATDKAIEGNRTKLKKQYDGFIAKHKHHFSSPVIGKLLSSMPDGALLLSLEDSYAKAISKEQAKRLGVDPRSAEAKPAAILSKRVIFPYKTPEKTTNDQDALAITLSESGRVDLDMLADLLDKETDDVIADLHDNREDPLIFKNPETGRWETADEYLGGNVVQKLNAAKDAGLEKNVAALEKIQPEPWGADKVTVMPGATWVPELVYSDFLSHLTGAPARVRFSRATNTFAVTQSNDSTDSAKQWSTDARGASRIVEALLNSKSIRITYTDSEGTVHVDTEATELANMKLEEIKEEFSSWVFRDGDRRKELVSLFNKKYNVRVNRQRNGQHLKFPGKVPDQIISLRRHQKNGIWRGIVDRFVLYDHAVGAGKTFTGIARAIERKRMGLSRKPMIVVPNHLVEQFAADVYKLYPGSRVLAAGKKDLERSKRRRLFARIATGDWDVVIVPHSSFAFIGIDQATEARYLENELVIAEEAVKEAEQQAEEDGYSNGPGKPLSVKQAEALRDKIAERLKKLKDKAPGKDRLLTFEQMGVDDLTVDEAHEFKNLFYSSNMQARGMNPRAGSAKAYDLWLKARVLRESGGSIAFMTGTPVSNSAVEMYGLMRYLAAEELQDMGLEHFDAWRAQFVDATTEYEPTESGRGLKEVNRLGRDWSNMRALMDLYYSFADCVTNDDIKQWYREDNNKEFPIPKVKGGGRVGVNVKPTASQEAMLQSIVSGFDSLPEIKNIRERNATRLRLMDQARKVSLDVRAINPSLPGEPGGKLEVAAKRIHDIYQKWGKDRGTQLVFLDRSVPKSTGDKKRLDEYDQLRAKLIEAERAGDDAAERRAIEALEKYDANEMESLRAAQNGGWNGYQQIKDDLVAMGIPANEIRFVQEANTDEQKQALFDDVNSGAVRVLLGSTPRMGAGTNVQERLVALHHIDVTWKPSDIEQREGRIIRQGNKLLNKYGIENFEVEIIAYTTETTIDAKLWSLNSTKLRMINGIRQYSGEFNMEFDDEDSVGMAEIAAIASGDPLQLERVKLDAEIKKLSRQQSAFNRQLWGLKDDAERMSRIVKEYPDRIASYKAMEPAVKDAMVTEVEEASQRTVRVDDKEYSYADVQSQDGPYRYVIQQYENAKDKKEKFSVDIDGEVTRSKDKAIDRINAIIGDSPNPWSITINGEQSITRDDSRRKIADLANAAMEGKPDDMGEIKVGTVTIHGIDFDLSVESESGRDGRGEPVKMVHFYFEHESPRGDGKAPLRINSSVTGTVLKINNKVNLNSIDKLFADVTRKVRDIPKAAETLASSLEEAKRDLPSIKERSDAVFPKTDELKEKRDRLADVERELASRQGGGQASADVNQESGQSQLSKSSFTVPISSRADIEGELRSSIGGIRARRLVNSGLVLIVDSQEEMKRIIGEAKNHAVKYSKSGAIQGAYVNGTAYLVRDGIENGQAFPVLMHELGEHAGKLGFADDEEYLSILKSLEKRKDAKGATGDAIRAAMARVPENTKSEHYWSEVAAYLVENNANAKLSIFNRIMAFFKKLLIKAGISSPDTLNHNDLVAFARSAVNAASGVNMAQNAMLSVREIFKSVDPNSPALKRWLGNSQITEPVFHGSPDEFYIFDRNKLGKNTSSPGTGLGFFFATDRNESRGYASPSGAVKSFYVKAENPRRMNASDLPKFRDGAESSAYAKRQQLSGYDSIILEDEGHVIVFEPNQVKSAEINTGAFDPGNPDVRYSLGAIEDAATTMASAAKKGSIKFVKSDKKDSSFLERLFSTPEYYFKKTSEAAGRVLQAALLRRDVRFVKQKEILGDFVSFVQDLRKRNMDAYKEANEYLVDTDQVGGFSIKEVEDGWRVLGRDGKEVSTHPTEKEAQSAMIDAELADMKEIGYSSDAIEAVRMGRGLTNRAFDVMADDMRRIIQESADNGRPNPFIGDGKIDEAGRYGVYAAGKKAPIALFRTEQEAKEMLAKVAEFVSYSVTAKNGKVKEFTSALKAKKWAEKRGGNFEMTKRFSNLSVKKRTDAEMRPMTVKEALAQMGDLRGSYFPRIRESGEYVLIARKDGENPFRQNFDLPGVGDDSKLSGLINSMTPIGRKARSLKAQGYDVTISKDTKPTDDVFDATNLITSLDAILQESMGEVNKNDSDEVKAAQVVDQIITMQIADIFKARGYLASRMKRLSGEEIWEGYETDMGKALTQYGKNIAAGTAKRDTARAMVLAFAGRDYSWQDYKKEVDDPKWEEYKAIVEQRRIDPGKQKNLFKDTRAFIVDVLRNDEQTDRVIGVLKGLAVHKFLGFRLSSAAVNATNMVTGVVGTMSGQTGEPLNQSLRRVMNAATQYTKYRSGVGDLSDSDRAIFQEIRNRGWDEAQFDHEAMSELRGKMGDAWNKYEEWSMFMFSAVEKANRAMSIFAALKAVRAKNPGMDTESQWNMAKEVSDKAHGVYDKATLPAMARGGDMNRLLRMPLTFTKFTHNYMLNALDLGFNKKEWKAAAYLLLSPAILAGSGATLATPVIAALAGALGVGGDDPEEAWYDWFDKTFGSDAFARHGLAGLLGVNIKGSLAINVPMPSDLAKLKLSDMAGPIGGIIKDVGKGATSIARGDVFKGVEVLLPTAFGSMLKAARESAEGITTSNYGSVFYGDEPLKATEFDAALRFLSFNPSRISGIREKQWNEKEVAVKYQERKTDIYNSIKREMLGDRRISPETMKEVKKYNDLVAGSGRRDISMITPTSIRMMLRRNAKPGKTERIRAASGMAN